MCVGTVVEAYTYDEYRGPDRKGKKQTDFMSDQTRII